MDWRNGNGCLAREAQEASRVIFISPRVTKRRRWLWWVDNKGLHIRRPHKVDES